MFRRGLKVLPDEVLSAVTQGLEEYPEEEMYSKDRPQPPKFKVHIKSQLNLNEDDHCIFEAKLIPVRDPMMRVQWFKNGKVLHHGKLTSHRSSIRNIFLFQLLELFRNTILLMFHWNFFGHLLKTMVSTNVSLQIRMVKIEHVLN